MPKSRLQCICLSATFPSSLRKFILNFLRPDPLIVQSNPDPSVCANQLKGIGVSTFCLSNLQNSAEMSQKGDLLKRREMKLVLTLKILESVDFNQCFIFAHNHATAHR